MLVSTRSWKRGKEGCLSSPRAFRESTTLLTPWLGTSGFRNCERSISVPNAIVAACGDLLQQPWGTNTACACLPPSKPSLPIPCFERACPDLHLASHPSWALSLPLITTVIIPNQLCYCLLILVSHVTANTPTKTRATTILSIIPSRTSIITYSMPTSMASNDEREPAISAPLCLSCWNLRYTVTICWMTRWLITELSHPQSFLLTIPEVTQLVSPGLQINSLNLCPTDFTCLKPPHLTCKVGTMIIPIFQMTK